MATKSIITCDLCKEEIVSSETMIEFSAAIYVSGMATAKFDIAQFCGRKCVLEAVNGLMNGTADASRT